MANRPMHTRGGAVIQAGLDPRPRGSTTAAKQGVGGIYRAVVKSTYVFDDVDNVSGNRVECDVVLCRSLVSLSRVPVKQMNHGRNNAWALWIPRESTRVIATGDAPVWTVRSGRGTSQGEATFFGGLDGDLVLVEFIENDPDRPLITGAWSHEQSLRTIVGPTGDPIASGWSPSNAAQTRGKASRNEFYLAHYGFEFRVNASGEMLIDTVGSFTDPATEDASPAVGQMRFRLKGGAPSPKFVVEVDGTDVLEVYKAAGQVRIDLGDGAAERLILGDAFKTFLNNFFSTIFDLHTHSVPALGTSLPPGPAFVSPTRQDMQDTLLSDLAKTKK